MKKRITLLSLILLLVMIFINSNVLVKNVLDYTEMFIKNLFPYTFIIFTISSMLIDFDLVSLLNKLKLNGSVTYITIMSMLSGFPSGAKYTVMLLNKGIISKETANYLITYTSFPNPLFILGVLPSIISFDKSIKLLLSIYLASFITSRLTKVKSNTIVTQTKTNTTFTKSLENAINNSLKTIIIIYGTSIFFFMVSFLINNTFKTSNISYCLINGFFDLTKGIFSTTILNNKRISAILILLFINLTSISIHMQVKTLIQNSDISYKNYLKGRIISTIFCLISFMILDSL